MQARYETTTDGSEALFRILPESKREEALLRGLQSPYAVMTLRAKDGGRLLLECRLVLKEVPIDNARANTGIGPS